MDISKFDLSEWTWLFSKFHRFRGILFHSPPRAVSPFKTELETNLILKAIVNLLIMAKWSAKAAHFIVNSEGSSLAPLCHLSSFYFFLTKMLLVSYHLRLTYTTMYQREGI